MFKKIALSLCFTLFLGLLTACSPDGFLQPKTGESGANHSRSKTTEVGTPVALPPAFEGQNTSETNKSSAQRLPNGLPALKPAKGINVDSLFSEELKDDGKRFKRVENAVLDLRKEFETYKPSIVRLAAVESDIQNLIKELEVLLQETPPSDVTQPPVNLTAKGPAPSLNVEQLPAEPAKPKQAVEKKPPEKKPPKPKKVLPHYEDTIAENLRAGEHADKVRIVLDTNKNTEFSIDLDNDEKLIIIELPNARWIGKSVHKFSGSKLVESYSVEPLNANKGSLVIIALKKQTQIVRQKRLKPDASNPYHRIYFDLAL